MKPKSLIPKLIVLAGTLLGFPTEAVAQYGVYPTLYQPIEPATLERVEINNDTTIHNTETEDTTIAFPAILFPAIVHLPEAATAEDTALLPQEASDTITTTIQHHKKPGLVLPEVTVFPVPARQELYLRFYVDEKTSGMLFWHDQKGSRINTASFTISKDDNLLCYNISGFAAGSYYITVVFENGAKISKQFIKN